MNKKFYRVVISPIFPTPKPHWWDKKPMMFKWQLEWAWNTGSWTVFGVSDSRGKTRTEEEAKAAGCASAKYHHNIDIREQAERDAIKYIECDYE